MTGILRATPSRNRGTPASCANRTGGMADWLGVDVTILPTPPAQLSPQRPKSDPVELGDLLPDVLAEMRRIYAGPIPRYLRHSLDQVAPAQWNVRYLYILTGPSGCVYIGQTYRPGARMVQHRERSKFWRHVEGIHIYRHEYQGIWHNVDAEIVDKERQAITDLVPLCNLERSLSEADRWTPWEGEVRRRNELATRRALRILGGA